MQTPAPSLSAKEKVAYGLGDTASNLFFQAFNLFLFFYYTDICGLSAAAVGVMMLFTRVLDAVLDPAMGIIADRTSSRWGKFRPYLLWGALPYGVLGYVMFLNPSFSPAGKLVYAYVTYSLMWVAYSAINIPYSALMGVMSASSADRTSLATYRFICAFSGGFLISALTLPLSKWLGHGNQAAGFRTTMAIFAAMSVIMFLNTFWHTRERVPAPVQARGALGTDLKCLGRNRPWLVLFVAGFLTLTQVALRNGAMIYYFKYVVGNASGFTFFSTSGTVAFIAGAVSTKLFLRLMSRRRLILLLIATNVVATAAFFFVDPHATVLLNALNWFCSFINGPTPAIVWSMYADTADFGEWKFRRRATALVFAGVVFGQKVGLAVGSAMLGWVLTLFGFVANAAQGPRSLLGIKLVFSLLPAAFSLLSGFAMLFYRLGDAEVRVIERDLHERHAAAPTAAVAVQPS